MKLPHIWQWPLTAVAFFLCLSIQNLEAHFEFTPIISSLTTTGKNAHSIAQVVNRSNEAIAITLKVTGRKLLEDGTEDRPETNDLVVFPNQFLLAPKETKMVKVSWQGPDKIPSEQAYRIIVEELPVDFTTKSNGRGSVRIMINYVGAIYVNSDPTEANIKLENVEVDQKDNKNLSMIFTNKGNAHAILKNPKIELVAKNNENANNLKILLDKTQLESIEGKNILANSKIKINIPKPKELHKNEQIEWSFSYEN